MFSKIFHFYHLIKGDVNSSKLRSIITVYLIIPQPLMAKKTAVAAWCNTGYVLHYIIMFHNKKHSIRKISIHWNKSVLISVCFVWCFIWYIPYQWNFSFLWKSLFLVWHAGWIKYSEIYWMKWSVNSSSPSHIPNNMWNNTNSELHRNMVKVGGIMHIYEFMSALKPWPLGLLNLFRLNSIPEY